MAVRGLVYASEDISKAAIVPPDLLHRKGINPRDIVNPSKMKGVYALWGSWAGNGTVTEQVKLWNGDNGHGVRPGDELIFETKPFRIQCVSGYTRPEEAQNRKSFAADLEKGLGFVYPRVEFPIDVTGDHTMSCFRLWSPIGRGAQVLIAGPWGSGKTWTIRRLLFSLLELARQDHSSMGNPYFIFIQTGGFERTVDLGEFRRELEEFRAKNKGEVPIEHYYGFDYGSNSVSANMALYRSRRLVEQGYDVILCGDSLPGIGLSLKAYSRDSSLTRSGLPMEVLARLQFDFLVAGQRADGKGSLTAIFTALTGERGSPGGVIYEDAGGPASTVTWMHGKFSRAAYPWIDLNRTGTRRHGLMLSPDRLEEYMLVHNEVDSQRSPAEGLKRLQELAQMAQEKLLPLLRSAKRRQESHDATRSIIDVAPLLKKVEDQVGIMRAFFKAADINILTFLTEFIQRLGRETRTSLIDNLQSLGVISVAPVSVKADREEYDELVVCLVEDGILEGPPEKYDYKVKIWCRNQIPLDELEKRLRAGENPDLIKVPNN